MPSTGVGLFSPLLCFLIPEKCPTHDPFLVCAPTHADTKTLFFCVELLGREMCWGRESVFHSQWPLHCIYLTLLPEMTKQKMGTPVMEEFRPTSFVMPATAKDSIKEQVMQFVERQSLCGPRPVVRFQKQRLWEVIAPFPFSPCS